MSQHHPIQLFSSVIAAGGNGCFDKSRVGTDVVGGYDIKRGCVYSALWIKSGASQAGPGEMDCNLTAELLAILAATLFADHGLQPPTPLGLE
jgi:hypothetical protein